MGDMNRFYQLYDCGKNCRFEEVANGVRHHFVVPVRVVEDHPDEMVPAPNGTDNSVRLGGQVS